MQTIEKSALQTELEQSAIAFDLQALNFHNIMGGTAWEYLFYTDSKELRTNSGVLRRKWLKAYSHIDDGGWWCGTLDVIHGARAMWGCFKPNSPRINKENGKTIKYEHPPTQPTQPFFLEVDRKRWEQIATMHGRKFPDLSDVPPSSDPFEFWEWVKNNDLPIIITEGAKKTASLLSANYCAIGLSGIWNGAPCEWADDGTKLKEKKLNPQLQAIAKSGREIIFCFDEDTKPKTLLSVTKATEATAELFEDAGCIVSVMSWRGIYDEKGIDDVHAAHGSDAVDKLFGDRLSVADWKKAINKPILKSGLPSEIDEQTVVEVMGAEMKPVAKHLVEAYNNERKTEAESNQPVKVEAVTSTPIAPVSEYDPSLEPDEAPGEEAEKPPALTYQEIALQSIFGKGHFISIQESPQKTDLYQFNGKFYEKLKPSLERKKIKAWASQYWVKDPKTGRKRLKYLTTACINEIHKYALMSFEVDKDDCNPEGFNLDNGILKIYWEGNTPKWRLTPHNPKALFFNCSPVKFDPNANPEMCDRLLEALEPLPRSVLMRNLSGIFDMDKIRELHGRVFRAGFAVGSGANGKDTFRDIVSLLFPQRVVSVPLTKFIEYDNGDAKALKKLEKCWVNWSSENNKETPIDKIQSLNLLVSGEKNVFEVEEKYIVAETMTEPPKAVYFFNCNNPPIIKSGLKSIQSRIVVYKFNKTFDPNPDYSKGELKADSRFKYDQRFQIEEVAPAFLNKMLEEFKNLALEGINYKPLESGMLELQEKSTHLWSFVKDVELVEDKNGRVWTADLWEALESWYMDNGTLEKRELYDGTIKRIWNDQPLRFDPNVTAANQIYNRFQKLFPNIENCKETRDQSRKNKAFLSGIKLLNPASLPHSSHHSSIYASPDGSPLLTIPNLPSPFGEAKSEERGEAESLGSEDGEAVRQNPETPKSRDGFAVGDKVIDKRTKEELIIVGLPTIGASFVDQSHTCRRSGVWWDVAMLGKQGGKKDEDPTIDDIAVNLETQELVTIKQFSEDGVWAWCERNDIDVPAKHLHRKEA